RDLDGGCRRLARDACGGLVGEAAGAVVDQQVVGCPQVVVAALADVEVGPAIACQVGEDDARAVAGRGGRRYPRRSARADVLGDVEPALVRTGEIAPHQPVALRLLGELLLLGAGIEVAQPVTDAGRDVQVVAVARGVRCNRRQQAAEGTAGRRDVFEGETRPGHGWRGLRVLIVAVDRQKEAGAEVLLGSLRGIDLPVAVVDVELQALLDDGIRHQLARLAVVDPFRRIELGGVEQQGFRVGARLVVERDQVSGQDEDGVGRIFIELLPAPDQRAVQVAVEPRREFGRGRIGRLDRHTERRPRADLGVGEADQQQAAQDERTDRTRTHDAYPLSGTASRVDAGPRWQAAGAMRVPGRTNPAWRTLNYLRLELFIDFLGCHGGSAARGASTISSRVLDILVEGSEGDRDPRG